VGGADEGRLLVSPSREGGSGSGLIKVVHLTTTHDPGDVRILHKECRTLAAAGYDVVLVVPHDEDEIREGVTIRAVPRPSSRLQRVTRTASAVVAAARDEGGDVFHLHDPELLPWAASLRQNGRRVIYDAHESLPKDIRSKHYIPPGIRGLVAAGADLGERALCAGLDGIVAVTPGIARRFPPRKTVVVRNYPRLDDPLAGEGRGYEARAPIVLYLGGISEIRGAHEMVRAIGKVKESLEPQLWLAGRFDPPALEGRLASEAGWSRTAALGWQTREQVAAAIGEARIGILALHPVPNFLDSLPVKLFEYMSAGIPVVASDFPAWRPIVEGAGLLVNPLDPDAIALAVEWLLEHPEEAAFMGRRGREAVRREYHWDLEATTLLALYRRVVGDPHARAAP
jgi:glycosyltransferase involved in cell wall biosynthesis